MDWARNMTKIALRIDQMNRKAVVFNIATVAGEPIYYATKIDHIADFGGVTKVSVGTSGTPVFVKSHDIYLDATNTKGIDKAYDIPDNWKLAKTTKWTLQEGDYLLSLKPEDTYPNINYAAGMTESQFKQIKETMHISSINETIYRDGDICMRTLKMDA